MRTTLKTTQLGGTGMEITRVGFGAWALGGGDWEFGWGPQQDDESAATIHRALELGVNNYRDFTEPRLTANLALYGRLKTVGERYGTSPGAVAVAWALRSPAVDGAIAGFRRPGQADPVIGAASPELTSADIAEIEGGPR
jgi:aryl-alcohol dehydrogenase-like predicted oxidoreductase